MSLAILNAQEVKQALPMLEAIAAMRSAFAQLANNQVVMTLRSATKIDAEKASILCMPAYLAGTGDASIKIVSVFPNNSEKGLATINGLVLSFDTTTGLPRGILDGAMLTAIRTGAVSGLATDLLAHQDAQTLAMIGAGAQSYNQIEAVCCVRPIKKIKIYSRDSKNAEQLAKHFADTYQVETAVTIAKAVRDADVICTATPATIPFLHLDDVKAGAHINAVGSFTQHMAELSQDLIMNAKLFVDQREAAENEAGELIEAINSNKISAAQLNEIGDVVLQKITGRESDNQITIFKSVGLAIQDVAAASAALKNYSQG